MRYRQFTSICPYPEFEPPHAFLGLGLESWGLYCHSFDTACLGVLNLHGSALRLPAEQRVSRFHTPNRQHLTPKSALELDP